MWSISTTSPGSTPTAVPLITSGLNVLSSGETVYDAVFSGSYLCVAGGSSTTAGVDAWVFSGSTQTAYRGNLNSGSSLPSCINSNLFNGNLQVTYQIQSGKIISGQFVVPALTPGTQCTVSNSTTLCTRITSIPYTYGGSALFAVFYEVPSTTAQLCSINLATFNTNSFFAINNTPFCNTLQLAGQPFMVRWGIFTFGVFYQVPYSRLYFFFQAL